MKFKYMLVSALLALSAQALAEPAPPIKVETSNQVHPAGTRYVTVVVTSLDDSKRTARTVLTGMCYSVGSVMRQGSSSLTRLTGQSAMTSRTWRR